MRAIVSLTTATGTLAVVSDACEPAPAHEARLHRLERAMRHDLLVALGFSPWRFLEPIDIDGEVANSGRQRQGANDAGGFNAWQRAHSGLQLIEEVDDRFVRRVLGRRNRHPHRQHAIGVETEIDVAKRRKRADHQSRPDDEHDRQRHFERNEGAAQPLAAAAHAGVLAAVSQ